MTFNRKMMTTEQKQQRIAELKASLANEITAFESLPKRGSFSGLSIGSRIESIQQELDRLGDKSARYYPEINVEVG